MFRTAVTIIAALTLAACGSRYDEAVKRYDMARAAGGQQERCAAATAVTGAALAEGNSADLDDQMRYISAQVRQGTECQQGL